MKTNEPYKISIQGGNISIFVDIQKKSIVYSTKMNEYMQLLDIVDDDLHHRYFRKLQESDDQSKVCDDLMSDHQAIF